MPVVGCVQGKMFTQAAPRFFDRNFAPHGAVDIYVKDTAVAMELAKDCGSTSRSFRLRAKCTCAPRPPAAGKDDASRVIEVYEGKDRAR